MKNGAQSLVGKLLIKIAGLGYRQKISLVILFFTLVPFLIMGPIVAVNTWKTRIAEILNTYDTNLKLSVDAINNILLDNRNKISYIVKNPNLLIILTNKAGTNFSNVFTAYQDAREDFSVYTADGSVINIYTFDSSVYQGELSNDISALDFKLVEEVRENSGSKVVAKFKRMPNRAGQEEEFLCVYGLMSTLNSDMAIVEVGISFNSIIHSFIMDIPSGAFAAYNLEDREVTPISYRDIEPDAIKAITMEYTAHKKTGDYLVVSKETQFKTGEVLLFLPGSFIRREMAGFAAVNAFILLLLIASIFISIKITSVKMTNRLNRLFSQTDINIEKMLAMGDFAALEGNDEFSRINNRFMDLTKKIKEYYHTVSEYQLDKKSLELTLLQERINPHFLYNTLASIRCAYPNPQLKQLVDSMVKYYRIALNRGNDIITVAQEMAMIREYINIQRFAYKTDLSYSIDISEEISECRILKHLLQPLVENAILHGTNGLKSGGYIRIMGRRDSENIVFQISDNGVGMDSQKVQELLAGEMQGVYSGYGIKNIKKRLELHHKGCGGLEISSQPGVGTLVKLYFPAEMS